MSEKTFKSRQTVKSCLNRQNHENPSKAGKRVMKLNKIRQSSHERRFAMGHKQELCEASAFLDNFIRPICKMYPIFRGRWKKTSSISPVHCEVTWLRRITQTHSWQCLYAPRVLAKRVKPSISHTLHTLSFLLGITNRLGRIGLVETACTHKQKLPWRQAAC